MKRKLGSLALAGVVAGGTLLAGVSPANARGDRPDTVVDIATSNADFEILTTAVVEAGLVDTLADARRVTVFAPTDEAFVELFEAVLETELTEQAVIDFLSDSENDPVVESLVAPTLLNHVVLDQSIGRFRLGLAGALQRDIATAGGLELDVDRHPLSVNEADVLGTVRARNGVVHVIDDVLDAEDPRGTITDAVVANAGALGIDTLLSIITTPEVVAELDVPALLASDGPFTVFAPTNEAFADAADALAGATPADVAAVLADHVVAGEFDDLDTARFRWLRAEGGERLIIRRGEINRSIEIVGGPIELANGTVYLIDEVILEG